MTTAVLSISEKITALPVIHGSGDFAIEVRRFMLEHDFDCLAVPLPPSFQDGTEEAILQLPGAGCHHRRPPGALDPQQPLGL